MSDAYDRELVRSRGSAGQRVAAATVGLSVLLLLGAALALTGALPVDRQVGGVSVLTGFGLGMLVAGTSILGLGVASSAGATTTTPDRTGGLVAGLVLGMLWALAGGLVAANTFGLGGLGWLTVAPAAGLGVFAVVVLAPEDLGATVPVAGLTLLAGGAVVAGLFDLGWQWSPATLSVTLPAHVVVPLLAILSALLAGWSAGRAHAGFGTRGRQTGAYLLISLVVATVLAVLVVLVAFIASRGLAPLFENVSIGAATGLLLALLPVGVAGPGLVDRLRRPHERLAAGTVLRAVLVALGLALVGFFALVFATGTDRAVAGVTVVPVARVGTGVALVVTLGLLATAWLRYDGIDPLVAGRVLPPRLRAAVLGGALLLAGGAGAGFLTDFGDSVAGLVLAPLAAGVAAVLAVFVLALLCRQWLRAGDGVALPIGDVTFGVTGSIGYLGLAVAFEAGSGLVPVASPSVPLVGGLATVPVAAQVIAVAFALTGVLAAIGGWRRWDESLDRHWHSLLALAALSVLASTALLLGHAVVTVNELLFFDLFRVTPFGSLQWPFLANPSQGLGIQTGVMPAVLGTVWLVVGAVIVAVPLAVGASVYLTEYAEESVLTRTVEVATNGLWSTPSVVFGLFGLAFIVPRFGNSTSLFAGQLVLAFMLLPLVLITSREAMVAVPDEYRDASAALGVSRWDTIRSVVIPAAMPGVITGVILGVGRIAGETAPLILVMRGSSFPTEGPDVLSNFRFGLGLEPPFVHVSNPALMESASALPYQLYAVITANVGENIDFAWGTALVLLGVVLAFYGIGIASRRYFRSKLHQ